MSIGSNRLTLVKECRITKANVSSKGQIAIPKAIRDRLNLKPGTQIAFEVQGEQLVMKRLVSEFPDWRTMRGMVASGPSLTKALEQEHRDEIAKDRDEIAKHNDRLVILYSWALLAWIRNESSAPRVDEILSQAERGELLLSMSWINAGEVFYVLGRKHSQKVADEFLTRLPSLPIRLVLPDESPALESARLKANRRISYADASADSLARREAAVLVTGDPELRSLENWVTPEWIGEALHWQSLPQSS